MAATEEEIRQLPRKIDEDIVFKTLLEVFSKKGELVAVKEDMKGKCTS